MIYGDISPGSVYFEICMYIVHMVSIYIQREAEKIYTLAFSVLKLRIIAFKAKEILALDFHKEAAPHPPNSQIYKTSSPAKPGTKHKQKPNPGIRSQMAKLIFFHPHPQKK